MNTYEANKNEEDRILYKVNPQRLLIEKFKFISPQNADKEVVTNFEGVTYKQSDIKSFVKGLRVDKLPAIIDGFFYCISEIEAQLFIKRQIGM